MGDSREIRAEIVTENKEQRIDRYIDIDKRAVG